MNEIQNAASSFNGKPQASAIRRIHKAGACGWALNEFGMRISFFLLALLAAGRASAADDFQTVVAPFLKQHCIDCHGADAQEGGVRFDRLSGEFDPVHAHLWTKVYNVLKSGKMPPEGEEQPSDQQKQAALDWIVRQDAAMRAEIGSGSRRRLNRREYASLVQSVLRIDLPQFESYLPGDRKLDGFDTVAIGLQDAAAAVDAYLQAVRSVVDRTDFLEPRSSAGHLHRQRWSDPDSGPRLGRESPLYMKHRGFVELPGRGLLFSPDTWGDDGISNFHVQMTFDKADFDGFMRVRLEVAALGPKGVAPPTIEVLGRTVEVTGREEKPQVIEVLRTAADGPPQVRRLKSGKQFSYTLNLTNRHTLPFDPHPQGEVLGKVRDLMRHGGRGQNLAELERLPLSWLLVTAAEIEVSHQHPYLSDEERAKIPADDSGAQTVLRRIATDAFRRPVSDEEWQRIEAFYQQLREEGAGLDPAIRRTCEFILASPHTRTLLPTDVASLRQYALASRLSFGLWSAPPDARLLELAAGGKLADPSVVAAEVDRLLADPRSEDGFIQPFTRNWLELEQPKRVAQAIYRHPDELNRFRFHILDGMERESGAYFRILLDENRPAREIVDSDWLPMNDAMAYHYGYPRLIGHAFRKVKLQPDDPRGGGMMGQAGVMSMTTWMGENWPIYRGAWALRHILNGPPPPPPTDVPELSHELHKGLKLREIFKIHTSEPKCAVCHRSMDALGFAFQNFDLSGRWRDTEYEEYKITPPDFRGVILFHGTSKNSWPVDTVGALPRGEKFANWQEFKRQAAEHYLDDVVRGQLQRYVLHFCSRQPTLGDQQEIERLMAEYQGTGYPMREMLTAFLQSTMFLGE